jgi:uncharacterized protein YwqG
MEFEEIVNKIISEFEKITSKPCYEISFIENSHPDILDDKIGGEPYLPEGEEYPKDEKGNNLGLLFQINLKQIDLENFPKKGILEIFTDIENEYPPKYKIKYFEEGKKYQKNLPKIERKEHISPNSYKIKVKKTINYMSSEDFKYKEFIVKAAENVTGIKFKDYNELSEKYKDQVTIKAEQMSKIKITMGGNPDFCQYDPRAELNGKNISLFKLDSMCHHGIRLGDAGILNVLISEEDLKKCNFDNCYLGWDCY